jgi:hypothetical protein
VVCSTMLGDGKRRERKVSVGKPASPRYVRLRVAAPDRSPPRSCTATRQAQFEASSAMTSQSGKVMFLRILFELNNPCDSEGRKCQYRLLHSRGEVKGRKRTQ